MLAWLWPSDPVSHSALSACASCDKEHKRVLPEYEYSAFVGVSDS